MLLNHQPRFDEHLLKGRFVREEWQPVQGWVGPSQSRPGSVDERSGSHTLARVGCRGPGSTQGRVWPHDRRETLPGGGKSLQCSSQSLAPGGEIWSLGKGREGLRKACLPHKVGVGGSPCSVGSHPLRMLKQKKDTIRYLHFVRVTQSNVYRGGGQPGAQGPLGC